MNQNRIVTAKVRVELWISAFKNIYRSFDSETCDGYEGHALVFLLIEPTADEIVWRGRCILFQSVQPDLSVANGAMTDEF
jgi:hypothetical protein